VQTHGKKLRESGNPEGIEFKTRFNPFRVESDTHILSLPIASGVTEIKALRAFQQFKL
jgi:hypothetical protein